MEEGDVVFEISRILKTINITAIVENGKLSGAIMFMKR